MGRVYITDFKEISTLGRHVATEFIVYDDNALTIEVYRGTETDLNFLYELRFNATLNGNYYFVSQNTRVKLRFIYSNGDTTGWFVATPSASCPPIREPLTFAPKYITP